MTKLSYNLGRKEPEPGVIKQDQQSTTTPENRTTDPENKILCDPGG